MVRKTHGKLRVALTRESEANAELTALLPGAKVYDCPLIRIVPPRDPAPLQAALARVADYDWLILTSANAARAVPEHSLALPRIACVGEATARIVREAGGKIALQPHEASSRALLAEFAKLDMNGASVLWPRSELAPSTLSAGLQAMGAKVDEPVAYANQPDFVGAARLRDLLKQGAVDAIAFASASAVRNATQTCGELLNGARLYAIGPSTARALREAGLKVAGQAADQNAAGLAHAILAGESSVD